MNEPFIDPRIIERVNFIKEKMPDTTIQLNSNGALITRDIADRLATSKLDLLTIGIEGIDPEDFHRLMPGLDFEDTMGNVRYLASLKPPFVIGANIIKFNSIIPKLEKTVQFWEDMGLVPFITEPWDSGGLVATEEINSMPPRKMLKGCYNIDSPFYSQHPLHHMPILHNVNVVACCMDWISWGTLPRRACMRSGIPRTLTGSEI